MNIRTAVISIVLAIAVVGIALFVYIRTDAPQETSTFVSVPSETLADAAFRFEIADTPAKRERGLSGRPEVPSGYGMLFIFDRADRYGFWMKDMHVPIDILWLADDGTVLAIEEAVSPDTYPTPFYPPRPVRLVLETKAGEARVQGWSVGSRIALPQ